MDKKTVKVKTKLKKGDKVKVISGKDKGKQGKILAVDRTAGRVIVEGVNMLTKHIKPGRNRTNQQGGLVHQEGFIHASNVMYLHNDKPTRLGVKIEQVNGKNVKTRIAKATGDAIKD